MFKKILVFVIAMLVCGVCNASHYYEPETGLTYVYADLVACTHGNDTLDEIRYYGATDEGGFVMAHFDRQNRQLYFTTHGLRVSRKYLDKKGINGGEMLSRKIKLDGRDSEQYLQGIQTINKNDIDVVYVVCCNGAVIDDVQDSVFAHKPFICISKAQEKEGTVTVLLQDNGFVFGYASNVDYRFREMQATAKEHFEKNRKYAK